MQDFFSLQDKTIIITGASSGIGRQCAIDCAKMNARVVLIARNEERLHQTLLLMEGNNHICIPFDITQTKEIPSLVEKIHQYTGIIHGVIHCAGISHVQLLQMISEETMESFFKTNVMGAMMFTKEICRKKNIGNEGASIIFISSIMGCVGDIGKSLYSMTKGALIAGVRCLACEYASKKIRFNCISPGIIETPINEKQPYLADPEMRSELIKKHPLGLGKEIDISRACIFLLSNSARWITGQNIIIDGGYTAR